MHQFRQGQEWELVCRWPFNKSHLHIGPNFLSVFSNNNTSKPETSGKVNCAVLNQAIQDVPGGGYTTPADVTTCLVAACQTSCTWNASASTCHSSYSIAYLAIASDFFLPRWTCCWTTNSLQSRITRTCPIPGELNSPGLLKQKKEMLKARITRRDKPTRIATLGSGHRPERQPEEYGRDEHAGNTGAVAEGQGGLERLGGQHVCRRPRHMRRSGEWPIRPGACEGERCSNKAVRDWMATAAADFSNHVFKEEANFVGLKFSGQADFSKATFRKVARFDNATFIRDARFRGTTFEGNALFHDINLVGYAEFSSATFKGNAEFENARFASKAWFDCATFEGDALFDSALFDEDVIFCSARFRRDARFSSFFKKATFDNVEFSSYAHFQNASFIEAAAFCNCEFSGVADFYSVEFRSAARFDSARFHRDARFARCSFHGFTSLALAKFGKQAAFTASQCASIFILEGAHFAEVPDFIQAHFAEAPRLDNMRVCPGHSNPDRSARYRALKRFAIDGHDHAREQEYFAGELKALRGYPDRLLPNPLNWFRRDEDGNRLPVWSGGARYWIGLIYQLMSNFGQSMLRPLGWWALAWACFTVGYLVLHFSRAAEVGPGYGSGVGSWLWASITQPLVGWFPPLANLLPVPGAVASPACLIGPGEPGVRRWAVDLKGAAIRRYRLDGKAEPDLRLSLRHPRRDRAPQHPASAIHASDSGRRRLPWHRPVAVVTSASVPIPAGGAQPLPHPVRRKSLRSVAKTG